MSISWSIFNASCHIKTRTGNGFNKIIRYILSSRQKREILFEATRTYVCSKLDVYSMCVRFATQLVPKWLNPFAFFLHCRHDRFIAYQLQTVLLFSNQDSKVVKCVYHLCLPHLLPSRLLLRPDLIGPFLLPLTAATQHHTKMMAQ